jgi:uncharacterized protein (DUF2147 family)
LMVCLVVSCGRQEEPTAKTTAPTEKQPSAPVAAKPEFLKLVGKWERPDGGYVLEIKGVDGEGKLEAAYANPNPIHVSRAMAFQKDGGTQVFVELRDTGYPGCTYSLKFDPKSDQLYGEYFQASMEQTFNVTFARLKESPN